MEYVSVGTSEAESDVPKVVSSLLDRLHVPIPVDIHR